MISKLAFRLNKAQTMASFDTSEHGGEQLQEAGTSQVGYLQVKACAMKARDILGVNS